MEFFEAKTKEEAIEWIHQLKTLGIKPGLKRMEYMLDRLGHPERMLKFVHVAGTNGKGSTVSFIAQVLRKAGYQVGTFTSPYLIDFTNRVQINGKDIPGEDLVDALNKIIPVAKELEASELGAPTEFEVITMIALLYFATKAYPDIVIWETGLGGRLDSTNIVIPVVSVITNISYDHMDLLGNHITEIAKEKAGIIKPGVPVVSGVENEEAAQVIKEGAQQNRASVYQMNEQFSFEIHKMNQTGSSFDFKGLFITMPDMEIQMTGPHQMKNAAVALMTLDLLRQYYAFYIDEDAFYSGMKHTFWPGRFEMISEKPRIVIDGAHNPDAALQLKETLSLVEYQRLIIVTGILRDKAIEDFFKPLSGLADLLIITQPDYPRAADAEEVAKLIHPLSNLKKLKVIKDWQTAVDLAVQTAKPEDLVLITGSLYLISDVRKYILEKYQTKVN